VARALAISSFIIIEESRSGWIGRIIVAGTRRLREPHIAKAAQEPPGNDHISSVPICGQSSGNVCVVTPHMRTIRSANRWTALRTRLVGRVSRIEISFSDVETRRRKDDAESTAP